jgi:hypothetical protein
MKGQLLLTPFLIFITAGVLAQADPLFSTKEPLNIALSLSIKEIKESKEDTSYISDKLYFRNSSSGYDSIKAGMKGRGNSRMELCFFPPLWIKIDKKDASGTLFEGNRKLKLVLPCHDRKESDDLVLREYLCYKLYEVISPYAFKTRIVNVDLTEVRKKKKLNYKQKGILLEDPDKAAKRYDAKLMKDTKVSATALHDTVALRFDLFQYMIANTDWSKGYQHNSKLIYKEPNFIVIPYDFDMSGLVNASYAVVSQVNGEQLPIQSVTERYYRGHCQSNEVTEFVRKEFISKEEQLMSVPTELKGQLSDKKIGEVKDYLHEFFVILKDDDLFQNRIARNCRSL